MEPKPVIEPLPISALIPSDPAQQVDFSLLENEQLRLKSLVITSDEKKESPRFIAGVDASFSIEYPQWGIASIVLLDGENQRLAGVSDVVFSRIPYRSGFLAFREVEVYQRLYARLVESRKGDKAFEPPLLFVDGNGIFHPREFGSASHLGVALGVSSVGCAKKIAEIDGLNKKKLDVIKAEFKLLQGKGHRRDLVGNSGKTWAAAVKNSELAYDALIDSIGHKVRLDKAVELVVKFSESRVVKPVNLADKLSRKILSELDREFDSHPQENKEVLAERIRKMIALKFDFGV